MSAESREILGDVLSDGPSTTAQPTPHAPPSTHIHQAAQIAQQAAQERAALEQRMHDYNAGVQHAAQQAAQQQHAYQQQQYTEPAYSPYNDPSAYDLTLADPWSVRELGQLRGEIGAYISDMTNYGLNVQEASARAAYGDEIVTAAQQLALQIGKGAHYARAGYDRLVHDFCEVEAMRMGSSRDWFGAMANEPVRPRRR